MPCPLCQQENPTGQKFCGECGTSLASPNQGGPPATSYADLQREVEHLARALSESLEQQTATSEILQVISASPTQLQPVLDAISERAARLCDAWNGTIVLGDGQGLRMEAHYGPLTEQLGMRLPIDQGSVSGRAFLERHPVHVDDLSEAADFPLGRQIAIRFGVRTILAVPLLREAVPIGVILIRRTEIRPFSNKQIALLQTFADQAVIAIENVRLFSELEEKNRALTQAHGQVTEALEQQTATAEVLQVISRSPTDVRPVFDTIVQNARRLCGADSAGVLTYDGEQIQIESLDNANLDRADALRRAYPMPANRGHATGRAILTGRPVQIPDVREDPEYALDALRDTVGLRSVLSVPMIRDRIPIPIGAITVQRWATPRPFSEKQIALLKTFSDQAVIAVANVRLFTELQEKNQALTEAHAQVTEALEQQTATSEILKAISRSTFDLQPVFDTMAENAVRLCEAERAFIFQFDGELLRAAASYNVGTEIREFVYRNPIAPGRQSISARAALERRTVHIPDVRADPDYAYAARDVDLIRTMLAVPIVKSQELLGTITIYRLQVKPFTDKQVSLVETFADQAVIAIENVRLFKELEARNRDLTEALEQQTATSEILRVISRSPTDLQPMFDAVAENAARLCDSFDANIFRRDGDFMRLVGHYGSIPIQLTIPLVRGTVNGRAVLEGRAVHVADVQTQVGEFPEGSENARKMGHRTILSVPLMREGVAIGTIGVRRTEVRLFAERQVALLQTFADQAVIAIENVRLFTELQEKNRALTAAHAQVTEALEQQTATAEILRVISRSQTDVQPVFDTIARSAVKLCDGLFSALFQFDGELLHQVAQHNYTPEALEELHRVFPARPTRALFTGRAILERAVVHIPDSEVDPEHQHRALRRAIGWRSGLFVPMLREGAPIGVIEVARAEPGPFSDSEIDLLKTFADQAVIAVENVRLFTELEARNRDLTEALDQQTAMAEILEVISTSPTHLQPVLDAVVKSAARFCAAPDASIFRLDGETLRADAHHGSVFQPRGFLVPVVRGTVAGRSVLERQAVSVTDLQTETEEFPDGSSLARQTGQRATLSAPLLREGAPIGVILLRRAEAVPFTGNQIALVKTFADQAVIAIENVRLFTELEARNRDLTEALDKQTATSEILRVISGSQTDVQPVFDTIIQSAVRLLGGFSGVITQIVDDQLHLAALTTTNPSGDAAQKALWPKSVKQDGSLHGHVISALAPRGITDVESDRSVPPIEVTVARERGYRSIVAVPLLRDGRAVGSMAVTRRVPGPFADSQVALLETFAHQAVIAIENVRLFKELDARTRDLSRSVTELRALSEVGQAISSTLDLQAVLSTIVARATELSGTDAGVVYEYDEQREVFLPRATEHLEAEVVETMLATPVRKGEGATGRLAEVHEPIQLADILEAPAESRVRSVLVRAGYRALLAVPLVREDRLIGGLTVLRKTTGVFEPEVIELLRTFATQSALAIQNARLFREIADKSRQLETASQHKSEFLANMSHELRTPLNAIIGFSEVLAQGMFGDINEKQTEYLHDILESGRHLLSLINDILDLSKIEAGRMELEQAEFDLPQAIQNALTLVRERALRRELALHHVIDDRVAGIRADERKVKQVLLNLLSNAIKFTPEGGRIEVRAAPADGMVEVSVTDTGVGIAPEDQEAVFEEFRQVGDPEKRAEGTGLGLALSRKYIELHGGKIHVTSQVGFGSTFTFTLPMR